MPSAFDPAQVRIWFEKHNALASAQEQAEKPLNLGFWRHALNDVVQAHLVGLGDDPRAVDLLALVRRVLSAALPTDASSAAPAEPSELFDVARAHATLALAEWIATGERQAARFALAHAAMLRYFAATYARKKPSMEAGVFPVIELACAAERCDDAKTFLTTAAPGKAFDPTRSRTIAELSLALAARAPQPVALAERFLRANVAPVLERGSYANAALYLYIASLAGLPGSPRALLGGATQYVSYLKPRLPRARSSRAAPTAVEHEPPPRPAYPRPPRIIASSEGYREALAQALGQSRGRHNVIWQQTSEGWAASTFGGFILPDEKALLRGRAPDLIELTCRHLPLPPDQLPRLARATLDGDALSALARAGAPVALEVSFAAQVDNWIDGRAVRAPPRLSRKAWADALAVNALTRLRALAFDARESDKERLARGAAPYEAAPGWFWKSRLAAQLEAVEVLAGPHDLASWLPVLDALPRLNEVMLWFFLDRHTAYLWFERREGGLRGLVQAFESPASPAWEQLLSVALTPAFVARVSEVDVAVVAPSADEASIRRAVGRHAPVGRVQVGATLREL